MSYILETDCNNCTKKDTCTDEANTQAGISKMYDDQKGHLGSGTVKLDCVHLDPIKVDAACKGCGQVEHEPEGCDPETYEEFQKTKV